MLLLVVVFSFGGDSDAIQVAQSAPSTQDVADNLELDVSRSSAATNTPTTLSDSNLRVQGQDLSDSNLRVQGQDQLPNTGNQSQRQITAGSQQSQIGGGGSCTIQVSSGGNVAGAVGQAGPGDVVCFAPGNYGHLLINGKNGQPDNPIEFTAPDGGAVFSLGGVEAGPSTSAVSVDNSSHIVVNGLEATNSMRGIGVNASQQVEVLNCVISGTGQEGFHVRDGSSQVRVAGCDISNTGNRPGTDTSQSLRYSVFGELVYVGNGAKAGDITNNITVENNVLHDNGNATSEAVNVKSSTFDVTVRNNHIFNIDSWCEAAVRVNSSKNLTIIGNVIHDISASGTGGDGNRCNSAIGIRFDSNNAVVENNVVFRAGNTGILAEEGSGGVIRNNTLFSNGTDFANQGSAQASNNLTSDGSNGKRVAASAFVGPIDGSADTGAGPGSGFELQTGVGGFSLSQS